jgi:hypothetical protein
MRMRRRLRIIAPEQENVVIAVVILAMGIFDAVVWVLLVKSVGLMLSVVKTQIS